MLSTSSVRIRAKAVVCRYGQAEVATREVGTRKNHEPGFPKDARRKIDPHFENSTRSVTQADGWRPASKAGEDLTEALGKSEK
jgi:hypothetical protein